MVLVKDTSDHWTIHEYNLNSNSLIETTLEFDYIQSNAMMADVDLDGDYDLIGNRGKSMVYIENTPSGLETELSPTFIDLDRASIFDYDNNGIIDLLSHNTILLTIMILQLKVTFQYVISTMRAIPQAHLSML